MQKQEHIKVTKNRTFKWPQKREKSNKKRWKIRDDKHQPTWPPHPSTTASQRPQRRNSGHTL